MSPELLGTITLNANSLPGVYKGHQAHNQADSETGIQYRLTLLMLEGLAALALPNRVQLVIIFKC